LDFPNLRGFVKEKIGKEKIMSCFWKKKKIIRVGHNHFGWITAILVGIGPFWDCGDHFGEVWTM